MSILLNASIEATRGLLEFHGMDKRVPKLEVSDRDALKCMREFGDGRESDLAASLLDPPNGVDVAALIAATMPLIDKYRVLREQVRSWT